MESEQRGVAKKMNIWLIVSVVLAIALVGVFATNLTKKDGDLKIVKPEEASTLLLDFINEVYGPQVGEATLKSTAEENGLYKVELTVMDQGQPLDQTIYVTKDAKLFIPQAIEIEDALAKFQEFQNQQLQLIEQMQQPEAVEGEGDETEETEGEEEETEE